MTLRILTYLIIGLLSVVFSRDAQAVDLSHEPIKPIPEAVELDPKRVALGKQLFHDTLLSKNKKISCASCHDIQSYGISPGVKLSRPGVNGIAEPINVPTVFNSGFNFIHFWDGRADSLEEQIDGPLHNENEMGMSWPEVMKRLNQQEHYQDSFIELYRSPPTEKAIKDAIATYERSLVTPNGPFDRYLRGDNQAISIQAKQGYSYFKKFGCASCHQGTNVGGNMFQTFGVLEDYFKNRGDITHKDLGRYNVTGDENDKYVFRVPPLRNVAHTAPYFHDGSAQTLEDAITVMGNYQLGRDLSDEEIKALKAFLESLSGEYHEEAGNE